MTLKQSKTTSSEVMQRLALSEENERRTEAARGRYMPVATRGAVLYFVLADLEVLNPMYQFSLQWFSEKFLQCISEFDAFPHCHVLVDTLSCKAFEIGCECLVHGNYVLFIDYESYSCEFTF